MQDHFPEVSCPRCHELAQLYTVPLSLIPPGAREAWQALCAECFRRALETEPWDDLQMRPIRHARRSRR